MKQPMTTVADQVGAVEQPVSPKLRVAAYIRVSTALDIQENSFEVQERYYTDMIRSNPDWRMAGIYADNGVTGTCKEHRIGFQRLMRHCEEGKIDRVLCKSLSRFARNTLDTLGAVRRLKDMGIPVFFEKENMGRTFYPRASKFVEASAPHPEGTEYKVSVGDEDWEGRYHSVVKIQMMYNGKVAGRKSPSYPIASDDYARVASAISELLDQQKQPAEAVNIIPAAPSMGVAAEEYVALICKIPRGQITRREDIETYLVPAASA